MHKNNLIAQTAQTAKGFTIEDLPVELVELWDEDLAQVCGGVVGGFQITAGYSGFWSSQINTEPNGNQLLVRSYVGQVAIPQYSGQ